MKRTFKILISALFLSLMFVIPTLGAEHEHSYTIVSTQESTCTQKGLTVYKCASCGDTYTKEMTALGHSFRNYWEIDSEPTCKKAGQKSRHCTRCDEKTDIVALSTTDHTFELTVVAPTCVSQGYDLYVCKICGQEIKNNIQNALGHRPSLWIIDKEPTCEDDGLRHTECTLCGITLEKATISATKHVYQTKTVAPTCTEKGYTLHTCTVCGSSYKDKETKALGHTFGEAGRVTENPTCTAKGSQTVSCKVCGVTQSQSIAALGHDYSDSWTIDKEATCSAMGQKSHHCKRCDSRKDVTSIEKIAHTPVTDEAIAPTCTTKGKTQGSHCLVCNATIEKQISTDALGHDYPDSWTIDKEATCSAVGQKSHHCTRCDAKTDVTSIEKLEHTEVIDEAVEPTCTEKGMTQGSHCSVCDAVVVKQTTVAALGHDYLIAKRISDPTCTEAGLDELTCSRCAEKKNQSVAKLGHDYTAYMIVDKEPTCTAKGEMSKHCLRCFARSQVTSIDRKEHTEVTDKAIAATCTESGKTKGSHCSICGKVLTAQTKISATGHTEKKTVTKATAKENGKVVVKCKTCNAVISKKNVYKIKTASLSKTSYAYDAKAHKPTVTIKDSKGKTLKKSTDYTVKYSSGRKAVGSYVVTITFKGNYSGTKKLKFSVAPKAPTGLSSSQSTNSITLSWKKVSSASGYRVYEYNTKTKKYTLIGKTKQLYFKIKNLSSAEQHRYAVKAYKTVDSKNYYSAYSSLKRTATNPTVPQVKVSSGAGQAVVSWNNVGSVEYEIYRAEKKNGKYICVGTTKKRKFVSSSLVRGKTYYFKVKACVKNSTTTLSSVSSEIKAVTVK